MDKLLKYSQLAKALGVSNASISMAIKNEKLIPEKGKKLINIQLTINKIWIENHPNKFDINQIFDKKLIKSKEESKKENKQPRELSEFEAYEEKMAIETRKIDQQQKLASLKKTQYETEKLSLQVKKIEGDLIPFEAVKTVFLYSVETFRSTYLQEVEGLATVFMERLGGDHTHFVELQKELTEKINEIQASVKEGLIQGLKGVVAEYKEVRNRGESK